MSRLISVFIRFGVLPICVLVLNSSVVLADWTDIDPQSRSLAKSSEPVNAKAIKARYLLGDIDSIRAKLLAGTSYIDLNIPLPEGEMATYRLAEYDFAESGFLQANPQLRAFKGFDKNNPNNRGSFDITPKGFHGMLSHNGNQIFIDPEYQNSSGQYMAYYAKDAIPTAVLRGDIVFNDSSTERIVLARTRSSGSSSGDLRTYRIAIATTGEYTIAQGGSVADARAEIVTLLVRINEIYERELGIRLQLIANNDAIIFENPATDPYSDNVTDLAANMFTINDVIGSENYDIGHLLGTGANGGVAFAGVVCQSNKAAGLSGSSSPTGDTFYVDLVAHEIGHQFNARHTFNGTTGNCSGGNRFADSAYEPGSGSTIMAYANICGAENLQSASDDYFHSHSIEQITAFVTSGSGSACGVRAISNNSVPVVVADVGFSIPANSAFTLTGSATDADAGDTLTYAWEQFDAGKNAGDETDAATIAIDNGSRPLYRSFEPVSSPSRTFPRLIDVVDGTPEIGETYPTTTRVMNFRLTARDGKGGTAFDETVVNVHDTGDTFEVTSPSAGDIWQTSVLGAVSWDVAGTDIAPINCSSVDILLSANGGESFPITLASGTPNDGSHQVLVPSVGNVQPRIMVRCSNNIFFAVNPSSFTIQSSVVIDSVVGGQVVSEGQRLTFVVTLNSATSSTEQLAFFIDGVNGGVTSADYDEAIVFSNGVTNDDGVLTVPLGVTNFTVDVSTIDDAAFENDELFRVSVAGESGTSTVTSDDVSTSPIFTPATTAEADPAGNSGGGGAVSLIEFSFLMALLGCLFLSRFKALVPCACSPRKAQEIL